MMDTGNPEKKSKRTKATPQSHFSGEAKVEHGDVVFPGRADPLLSDCGSGCGGTARAEVFSV